MRDLLEGKVWGKGTIFSKARVTRQNRILYNNDLGVRSDHLTVYFIGGTLEGRPMPSHISKQQYSEQTLRQVAADCRRSLQRGHFNVEQSRVERLRCVDDQTESDEPFGRQLWYFEGQTLTGEERQAALADVRD